MFRASALLMVMCIAAHVTLAPAQPARDLSVLDFDSEEDGLFESEPDPVRTDLSDAGSVILAIKDQFKDIIVEIGLQVFKYLAKILRHFKVKLLKKLGMYTLSDVFHTVFDGVTDFVVESSPGGFYYETKEPAKPVVKPNPNYGYNNPYGLSSLFSRAALNN